MIEHFDIAVVGAGIAGASVAYELADSARVVVFEQERLAGYHSTGRSAALLNLVGGGPRLQEWTRHSRSFLVDPPDGFVDTPLLSTRPLAFVARADQMDALDDLAAACPTRCQRLDGAAVERRIPCARPGHFAGGLIDEEAFDIDVHALHQGYLRGFKHRGGVVRTERELLRGVWRGGVWDLEAGSERARAPLVINAAGAWADVVGERLGVAGVGLTPYRRTLFAFTPQVEGRWADWPFVIDIDEDFYFKPDGPVIVCSPGDETPVPPCDVQAQAIDVATGAERIQRATTLQIARISNRWAGLRTFHPDRLPVVGFDPEQPALFWLAGQGGCGIRTAPALSRLAADVILRGASHPDLAPRRRVL